MRLLSPIILTLAVLVLCVQGFAQQTNPVERQVANPITDTPNINPVSPQQSISAPNKRGSSFDHEGGEGEIVVYSKRQTVEGEEGKRVLTYIGDVDARYGAYRMQADKITLYEAEDKLV